ncbi:hypothetical protein SCG7109_AP_00070 [Chlamydiales bacterium SCGC AG-110-M15]|nr:hypothetical protein SCG7109_AP_00070 [Chlamydiales bacterium SCGC AG-110-M15]
MKTKAFFSILLSSLTFYFSSAQAEMGDVHGKIDVGVAIADLELISGGERGKAHTLEGISTNGSIIFSNGFTLKPAAIYAEDAGNYYSLGMGFGWYIPLQEGISILPNVGVSYSRLIARTGLPTGVPNNTEMRLRSRVQYMGMEVAYKLCEKLLLTGGVQHAWNQSTSSFSIAALPTSTAESRGFNYSASLDYYLNESWTVQLAGTIQHSRSNETEGSDAKGVRLGLGYIF